VSLPGINPGVLGRLARSLIAILMEPSRLQLKLQGDQKITDWEERGSSHGHFEADTTRDNQ
jgi:hypothetical protein